MDKEFVTGAPKLFDRYAGAAVVGPCAGCNYPLVRKAVLEVIQENDLEGEAISIIGVGCQSASFVSVDLDSVSTAHGRPADVAAGVKRVFPERLVFTMQGDGDTFAIGTEATVHAAARGEKITQFMVNNGLYGMTGGQMAPTTLIHQVTSTTPKGRKLDLEGSPIHVAELLSQIEGVAYSARCAVNTPANYQRAKRCIKTAFQMQMDNIGYTFVEFLSACPVGWGLSPIKSLEYIEEKMIPVFPLGEFKNVTKSEKTS